MRIKSGRFLAAADEMMMGANSYHFAYVDFDGRPALSCTLTDGRIPVNVEVEPWLNEFRNYRAKVTALDLLDRIARQYADGLAVARAV